MPTWTTREELDHQTVTLSRQGMTRRAIARALGVSRNTIRKILVGHATRRELPHEAIAPPPSRAPRPTKLDDFTAKIAELLERYPAITAQRVFEELRAAGCKSSYTQVKQHVRKVRPKPRIEPSLPTPIREPGKMAESDWSPYTIAFDNGVRAVVQAFSYALRFSKRKSFVLYERSDFHSLLDGHVKSFDRFAGVAEACKYDCQKAVVLGWEGKQAIYNPRFLAFATHYEFRPEACRPGHPNDKPTVERSFWEFEKSFLNGRHFRDLDDMRAQLAAWQDSTLDLRPHKRLKRTALDMFADEAPHLRALPRHPYDTARVVYRVCSIDGFVDWEGNRYAVPYDHVTDILPVRITQAEFFVYAADLRCVARHELAPRGAGMDIDPQQLHPPAQRRSNADREQLRVAFDDMGGDAAEFFAGLAVAAPRLASYHARQILLLRERYATPDLCAALRHARAFGAFEHGAVARILAARTAPRTLAEYVAENTARRLEETLGESATGPRDLDEYDRLPLTPSQRKEAPWPSYQGSPALPTRTRSSKD
jgi:transposase